MESARDAGGSGDPIPALAEERQRESRGSSRTFRWVLGVPVVNLIFRRLAILPGGLE